MRLGCTVWYRSIKLATIIPVKLDFGLDQGNYSLRCVLLRPRKGTWQKSFQTIWFTLDKCKKTTQILPLLHHRCSWLDYPSHRGSVGTETGQRRGDTGLLGHSRDCSGQTDLISELTVCVILEEGSWVRSCLFASWDYLTNPDQLR